MTFVGTVQVHVRKDGVTFEREVIHLLLRDISHGMSARGTPMGTAAVARQPTVKHSCHGTALLSTTSWYSFQGLGQAAVTQSPLRPDEIRGCAWGSPTYKQTQTAFSSVTLPCGVRKQLTSTAKLQGCSVAFAMLQQLQFTTNTTRSRKAHCSLSCVKSNQPCRDKPKNPQSRAVKAPSHGMALRSQCTAQFRTFCTSTGSSWKNLAPLTCPHQKGNRWTYPACLSVLYFSPQKQTATLLAAPCPRLRRFCSKAQTFPLETDTKNRHLFPRTF